MKSYCCNTKVKELEVEKDNIKLYQCSKCLDCFKLSGCYEEDKLFEVEE